MTQPSSIVHQLSTAARWIFNSFLFLFPLFFLPFTLDPLEINKQSLLLLCVCSVFVLLIGSLLLKKEAHVKLGLIQLFPIGICIAFAVSAYFSFAPYVSWIGTSGAEYTSVLTWIGLALLFGLCTLFQSELQMRYAPWLLLIGSATLVGLFGVLSIFGVSVVPFFPSLAVSAFNTVGTVNTFAIFLVIMSLFACSRLVTNTFSLKSEWKTYGVLSLFGLLFLETLILLLVLDYSLLWLLFLLGCGVIFVFSIFRSRSFPSMKTLFIPVVFTVVSLFFWLFLPTPFKINLPLEVSPSMETSKIIMEGSMRDTSSLIGTGPGTYAMNYAKFHPKAVNETDFWNTRFDRAPSFFLTLAPTVGYLGAGFYLFFLVFLFCQAISKLLKLKQEEDWVESFSLFVPWTAVAIASFLFSFNGTLVIVLMLFSGLLVSQLLEKETHLKFSQNKAVALLSAVCFVGFLFALFIGIFLTTGRYTAEIAYTQAIRADRSSVDTKAIVAKLDRAATLNKWNDDYMRNLSAVLLLRVQDELKSVSSNSALSDPSKQYLQALVAASVNASARATSLSPHEVSNWLTRGEVYRSLTSLVDKAPTFAVDAYKHAIDLEPLNPNHWNELGKTHLAIADMTQPLTLSKDPAAAAQAKKDWQGSLDNAEKAFTNATQLKSNFAPAHYQLALVYEREGKLDLAIQKLESVEKYNDKDIGVGFELGTLYTKRGGDGDLDRAKQIFLHVIELAPSYSDAHWFLGSIYEKLGDHANAVKEIETVLKLNPNNQIVKTRLQKLQSGGSSP
ncbi:MAG: tetratricopeptide repeat protein [Candidatus Uhrbacteria bacterium]|nr:tetratricopeptide repeat protein [Candidatus Uhrbacteria bacterium]